jgi:hypothetical protein
MRVPKTAVDILASEKRRSDCLEKVAVRWPKTLWRKNLLAVVRIQNDGAEKNYSIAERI